MYDYYDIIENHKPIIVDGNVLELPNAWYLTKDGTLYNSMGKQGHDHSVLEYEVSDITWRRIEPSSFEDLKNKYHTLYNSIRENGYVSYEQCIQFLNIELNNNIIKNAEINHKLLLNLVLGVIKAHVELYNSYIELLKVNDYDNAVKKVMELSRFRIDDFLVRFIHMSKVKHGEQSFICTTNPNIYQFREYRERGYRMDIVDPIVVKDGELTTEDLSYYRSLERSIRS